MLFTDYTEMRDYYDERGAKRQEYVSSKSFSPPTTLFGLGGGQGAVCAGCAVVRPRWWFVGARREKQAVPWIGGCGDIGVWVMRGRGSPGAWGVGEEVCMNQYSFEILCVLAGVCCYCIAQSRARPWRIASWVFCASCVVRHG
jgi:hypothetical protein